jgi:hypothetical protein
MPGQPHQFTGQQPERPTGAAGGRFGTGGGHQQRLFAARQQAGCPRARVFRKRPFQIAVDKAALGPAHRRSADRNVAGDGLFTLPGIQVSPPTVHQMVLTLERAGLIRRQPGVARSIEVLVAPECLPVLR